MGLGEWDALFEGLEVTPALAEGWVQGLGFNRGAPAEVLIRLFAYPRPYFFWRQDLPREVGDAAVACPVKSVFVSAAEARILDQDQWGRLLDALPPSFLREILAEMAEDQRTGPPPHGMPPFRGEPAPTTPEGIAEFTAAVPDIEASDRTIALWWVAELHDDPDAMRLLARSPKLWIRRSVARAPHLPPDVVDLLARDDDRVVRLFLSESCDDAPPEMLLEVWSWWEGSFSFPGRPLNHPNFPREGMLRFADDPDPRMRMLALRDPASTPDLVDRFTRDPASRVRAEAAADPRLSPESAVRLADASSTVCHQVAANPVVPTALLISLLRSATSAHAAGRNAAIPVPVMHRMLDAAAPHCEPAKPYPGFTPSPSPR